MRRLAPLAALALSLCSCAASSTAGAPRCLTGPAPRVGRPAADEMLALMRRERDRAERAPSPLVRARILEAIPGLFPDMSGLARAPRCSDELADESAAALRGEPLVFSRLLVARLRTARDPGALLPLVTRREESITTYQLGPEEPAPPRSLVRSLALASLPAPWLMSVLEELGLWLPPDEASRRFDALVAPVFDGERVRLSTEALCRMRVALRLDGVDEARRVRLLLRLLSATPAQIGPPDTRGDEPHPALATPIDAASVAAEAARALDRNLGWLDRHADLRAWLEAQALAPVPPGGPAAARWRLLQPAFERVVALHASGGPAAGRRRRARFCARGWIRSARRRPSSAWPTRAWPTLSLARG
ncbi:hypothetical protein WME98_00845 [Sorangium sp. So ce296]|uniref:hypothetical protein n=1 Tax=Sorangium sp. So ce296 TaxID=3133296 RepID=UPI003F5F5E4D